MDESSPKRPFVRVDKNADVVRGFVHESAGTVVQANPPQLMKLLTLRDVMPFITIAGSIAPSKRQNWPAAQREEALADATPATATPVPKRAARTRLNKTIFAC
jgi:hypothetical protein